MDEASEAQELDKENEDEVEQVAPTNSLTPAEVTGHFQQKLAQKLTVMPELDGPGFWQWVEQPADGRLPQLEALAWAIHEFASQNQEAKAERVFNTLYSIFNPRALKLAQRSYYVNLAPDARVQMAEDVGLLAWQEIYRRLTTKNRPFIIYNFTGYVSAIFNTKARDLALEMNLISRTTNIPKTPEIDVVNNPAQTQKPAAKTKVVSIPPSQSLDAPFNSATQSTDNLTLGSAIADHGAVTAFDQVEFIEIYQELVERLTSEEKQILLLRLDGNSVSEIARVLKRDWQTIDRRLDSIGDKAGSLVTVKRVEKAKRRKAGRPAKGPVRG